MGTGWAQAPEVLFPFTATMAPSAPCSTHTPHRAKQGAPQDRNRATSGGPKCSCPLSRAGPPAARRDQEAPSRVNAGSAWAERGWRARPAVAQAVHFTARGPGLQPWDGGPQRCPRRHRKARTVSWVTGTGRRAGPRRPPASRQVWSAGLLPTRSPGWRGRDPHEQSPWCHPGRRRKALKRRAADVGVHQGGPWVQGARPSRRARPSGGAGLRAGGAGPCGTLGPQELRDRAWGRNFKSTSRRQQQKIKIN